MLKMWGGLSIFFGLSVIGNLIRIFAGNAKWENSIVLFPIVLLLFVYSFWNFRKLKNENKESFPLKCEITVESHDDADSADPKISKKRRTKAEMMEIRAAEEDEVKKILEEWRNIGMEEEFFSCSVGNYKPVLHHARRKDMEKTLETILKFKELGIEKYKWVQSGGGNCCQRCTNNNGKEFLVDERPTGGYPGEAPGCMCSMQPIIKYFKQ